MTPETPADRLGPVQQHQAAVPLLASPATRIEGLRLTLVAALRQRNARMAMAASEELVGRSAAAEDLALRGEAQLLAGDLEGALATSGSFAKTQSPAALGLAARAHILIGNLAKARQASTAAAAADLEPSTKRELSWLGDYAGAVLGETRRGPLGARWGSAPEVEPGVAVIALMDYKSPEMGCSSINVGDMMQTLAAARHLARFEGLEWSYDDPRLADLMSRLAGTWPKERRIASRGRLHVAIMDRDYPLSLSHRFPDRRCWVIANGWFAHKLYGHTRAWPMAANLEPLLVSVHMAQPSDLTPDRLEWLVAKGPIGCRDRSTLHWLRNQGVEAYFSGCLTMTLATAATAKSGERLAVDAEGFDGEPLSHRDPSLREQDFATAMGRAADLLDRYAAASVITTTRLHCALPARAVGTRVRFVPKRRSDPRFDGLTGLGSAEFCDRATTLDALMADLLPRIVAGEGAGPVRDAIRRHFTVPPVVRRPARALQRIAPATIVPAEVTVAVAFDQRYAAPARAMLLSLRENTDADVRIVALVRGLTRDEASVVTEIARPFETRIFHMEAEFADRKINLVHQASVSTMDRLFLPALLPDIDRLVYLDSDVMLLGDVRRLAAHETGPRGISARSVGANLAQGLERWVKDMPAKRASALRDWAATNSDLAWPEYDPGVLLMSLDRMRAGSIDSRALDLVRRFGLGYKAALNLSTGGGTHGLPEDWTMIAGLDLCVAPKLLHWAGRAKPWLRPAAPFQAEWRELAARAKMPVDKAYWSRPSSYKPNWSRRAAVAARLLPSRGRVADLGCGPLMSLKEFLDAEVQYVPADLTAWTPGAVVDPDKMEFPPGRFGAAAMLEVLEYLANPGKALLRARSATDRLVISYCHPSGAGSRAQRAAAGWVNAFREETFPALLRRFGWEIECKEEFAETNYSRQIVYACRACERARGAGKADDEAEVI